MNDPGNTQTADQIASEVKVLGGHGVGQPDFDPLAFKAVTAVRFGTTGRNILRGPGAFSLDASLFRNFRIAERFGVQVRMEMFGVTNTPQFGNSGANMSNLSPNGDGSLRALGGFTEITGASGDRQIRFAAKLTF